jgi:hypothetical protein
MAEDAERKAFIQGLLERASQLRMPELFAREHPEALWHVRDRHGVSVVAVRTPALTQEQLVKVLTYRLVQYLLADQLDPQLIFEEGLKHEPLSNVSSGDVHVLAGTSSGEMLCYFTIESLAASRGGTTLRTVDTAGVVTAVLPVILLVVLLVVRLDPGNWVGAWGGLVQRADKIAALGWQFAIAVRLLAR